MITKSISQKQAAQLLCAQPVYPLALGAPFELDSCAQFCEEYLGEGWLDEHMTSTRFGKRIGTWNGKQTIVFDCERDGKPNKSWLDLKGCICDVCEYDGHTVLAIQDAEWTHRPCVMVYAWAN